MIFNQNRNKIDLLTLNLHIVNSDFGLNFGIKSKISQKIFTNNL